MRMSETLKARTSHLPKVSLLGLTFLKATEAECVNLLVDTAVSGVGGWVLTPNLDILRQCSQDPEVFEICGRADMRVADGMPLIWASKLQRTPLPERVSGSNLIEPILEASANNGLKVFLLGGAPGVVERTRRVLMDKIPNLSICGVYCPPFGFERDEKETSKIIFELENSRPNIVFVALSFPKSEKLIEILKVRFPNILWIGVGISFSFISGDIKRAPLWMQKYGLEWLFRIYQEPTRLFRRYIIHDFPFLFRLFLFSFNNRVK